MSFYLVDLNSEILNSIKNPKILNLSESNTFLLISLLFEDSKQHIKTIIINKNSKKFFSWSQCSQFMSIVSQNNKEYILKINNNLRNFQMESFEINPKTNKIKLFDKFNDFELIFRKKRIIYTKFNGSIFLVAFRNLSPKSASNIYMAFKFVNQKFVKCLNLKEEASPHVLKNCYRILPIYYSNYHSQSEHISNPRSREGISFLINKKISNTILYCQSLHPETLKIKYKWDNIVKFAVNQNTLFLISAKDKIQIEAVDLITLKRKNIQNLSKLNIEFSEMKLIDLQVSSDDLIIVLKHSQSCYVFTKELDFYEFFQFPRYLSNSLILRNYQIHLNSENKLMKIIDIQSFYNKRDMRLTKSSNKSKLQNILNYQKTILFVIHNVQKIGSRITQLNLLNQKLDFVLNTVNLKFIELDIFSDNKFKNRTIEISNYGINNMNNKYPYVILRIDLYTFSIRVNEFILPEIPSYCRNLKYYGWDYYLFLMNNQPLNYSLYLSSKNSSVYKSTLGLEFTEEVNTQNDAKLLVCDSNLYEIYVFRPSYKKNISSYIWEDKNKLKDSQLVNSVVLKGKEL